MASSEEAYLTKEGEGKSYSEALANTAQQNAIAALSTINSDHATLLHDEILISQLSMSLQLHNRRGGDE